MINLCSFTCLKTKIPIYSGSEVVYGLPQGLGGEVFWQAVSLGPWHGAGWWGFGQHDGDGAKAKEKDHSHVVLCVGEAQRFPEVSCD